jgi:hypothetical protein
VKVVCGDDAIQGKTRGILLLKKVIEIRVELRKKIATGNNVEHLYLLAWRLRRHRHKGLCRLFQEQCGNLVRFVSKDCVRRGHQFGDRPPPVTVAASDCRRTAASMIVFQCHKPPFMICGSETT